MSIPIGTRLGPYEIAAPLGAGGMGEVYRARDSRLGRDVAIKVLPEDFSSDTGRRQRFEQEARAIAALNHPNIVAIYDVGEGYIVTELVDGETLRGSKYSARKVIDIGAQIAAGLAAAHDAGIVHRDLKPDNILLTREGRVKILDFGLAKVQAPRAAAAATQTVTVRTEPGLVMGTIGYMSPEQVRGAATDHRTDIFCLGLILHEMLTGARVFHGDTSVETMTAILKQDAPELPEAVPASLRQIVAHCLEKDPANRFQSARDLAFALSTLGQSGSHAIPAVTGKSRRWAIAAMVAIPAAAAIVFAVVAFRKPPEISFERMTYRLETIHRARFSPDSQMLLYSAAWNGKPIDIYSSRKDDPEARSLGLSGVPLLAVSRKGQLAVLTKAVSLVVYEHLGTLALVPIGGGAPREILNNVTDADFDPDGEALAVARLENGKTRIEYPAGKLLFETGGWISWLRVSPDGAHVAFFYHTIDTDDRGDVAVLDRSGKLSIVSTGWESLQGLAWSPKGEVWFTATRQGSEYRLYAASTSGKVRAVLVAPGIGRILDIAPDGRVLITRDGGGSRSALYTEGVTGERDLCWLESSGLPHFSSDGSFIAFSEFSAAVGPYYAACMRKIDASPVVRLGDGAVNDVSPDGRWVLSLIPRDPPQIVLLPTGAGQSRVLPRGKLAAYDTAAFFHDGRRILLTGNETGRGKRIYVQDLAGGDPVPITEEGVVTFLQNPIAPDDQSLVVVDSASTVMRASSAGGTPPERIAGTEPGDNFLSWMPDGDRILVHHPPELRPRIFAIHLKTGSRTFWKQIVPEDLTGLQPSGKGSLAASRDGKSLVYVYSRVLSTLYTMEGLR